MALSRSCDYVVPAASVVQCAGQKVVIATALTTHRSDPPAGSSGLVLDLQDGGYDDGNPIQQWAAEPPGNPNQNWILELVR
jgi:hypothetical protein